MGVVAKALPGHVAAKMARPRVRALAWAVSDPDGQPPFFWGPRSAASAKTG